MGKITKQEYESAKKIVDEYESHLESQFQYKLRRIKSDLIDYFKENLVCGFKIKKFDIEGNRKYDSAELISYDPYFDEDYCDEKVDSDIEKIGESYGIRLSWESSVYPK